jgi:hypothetical protein
MFVQRVGALRVSLASRKGRGGVVEINSFLLITACYRLGTIIVGFAIVHCGYKLFSRGVYEKAGDLRAAWGDKHLLLKQAAPGTFFALFGTAVIIFSLFKGIWFDRQISGSPQAQAVGLPTSFRFPDIDQATLAVAEKASRGETLSESEKKQLAQWTQRERNTVHAEAPSEKEKFILMNIRPHDQSDPFKNIM